MESAARFPFAPAFPPGRVRERRLGDLVAPADAVISDTSPANQRAELVDPATARQVVRETAPTRFFGGVADTATAALLRQRFSSHCQSLVAVADVLAQQLPWNTHRTDPLLAEDPAIAWEPRRHHWLVRIAQAY